MDQQKLDEQKTREVSPAASDSSDTSYASASSQIQATAKSETSEPKPSTSAGPSGRKDEEKDTQKVKGVWKYGRTIVDVTVPRKEELKRMEEAAIEKKKVEESVKWKWLRKREAEKKEEEEKREEERKIEEESKKSDKQKRKEEKQREKERIKEAEKKIEEGIKQKEIEEESDEEYVGCPACIDSRPFTSDFHCELCKEHHTDWVEGISPAFTQCQYCENHGFSRWWKKMRTRRILKNLYPERFPNMKLHTFKHYMRDGCRELARMGLPKCNHHTESFPGDPDSEAANIHDLIEKYFPQIKDEGYEQFKHYKEATDTPIDKHWLKRFDEKYL